MTPLNKELRLRVLVTRYAKGTVKCDLSVYNDKGRRLYPMESFSSIKELDAVLSARYNAELAQPYLYPMPAVDDADVESNRWYYTSAGETAYLYLMWYRPADLPLVKTAEGRIEHG